MSNKTVTETCEKRSCQNTLEICVKVLPMATAVSLLLIYIANVMVSIHIKAFLAHFCVSPQLMAIVEQHSVFGVLLSLVGLFIIMIYCTSSVIDYNKHPSFLYAIFYTMCFFVIIMSYLFFVSFGIGGSMELLELAMAETGLYKKLCITVLLILVLSASPYAGCYISNKFPIKNANKRKGNLKRSFGSVVALSCFYFIFVIWWGNAFYASTGKQAASSKLRFDVWSADEKNYAIIYMNDKYAISEEINFKDKQLWSLGKKIPDDIKLPVSEDMIPEIYYGQQIITEIKDLQKITPVRFIHAPILKEKPNKKPNKDGKDNNLPIEIKSKPNMLPTMPKSQKTGQPVKFPVDFASTEMKTEDLN